ncbi:DUF2637 domain-containing protein [Streptomyces sp. NPDC051677]|uniref:DUF2637 domain-containing protein n=1 Tax=Streptomyces sp. NPDC051677 TaxID=3365669 RepID=UPI0037CD5703
MTSNREPASGPQKILATVIGIALSIVVVSPVALSSQDLVRWAKSENGLGLNGVWPYVVFVALDCAAALCISLTVYAAWRGESGGAPHILVWVFAGASAFANYRHSLNVQAKDAVWFFPGMSIAGATLLEVVIRRIRRWGLSEAGVFEPPLPRFRVLRWIVAREETYRAWKTAVIEGITRPEEAVSAVRGTGVPARPRSAVTGSEDVSAMSKADALRYAFRVLDSYDVPAAVDWLAERGVIVNRSHAHNVARNEKRSALGELTPVPVNGVDLSATE